VFSGKHLAQISNTTLDQPPPYPHALRLLREGVILFIVLLVIALLVYAVIVSAYIVLRERSKTDWSQRSC
jgi:heme/copper-type cytochrome/quinol oxidase subunit 2